MMTEEAAVGEESDLSDFEIDDEIKHELNSLMNLEFIQTSSDDDDADEEKEEVEKEPEKEEERQPRGDSLERELEMMFMSQHVKEVPGEGEEGASKDTGLESISDNELDGPESGECDTSDGELPDSPSIVVTVPDTPPINHVQGVEDLSGSSDVELVEDYQGREYYEQPQKPAREVIIESRESVPKKKEKSPSKSKDKTVEKGKKDKKDKSKKKIDSEGADDEKRRMKLEKYMARLEMYKAKCRDYMKQITKKYDYMKKNEKTKIRVEKSKIKNVSVGEGSKLKSIVKEVNRDISPQSSTSSKFDRSSHSSRADKSYPPVSDDHGKRSSSEKERKSKHKKSKSKSKELKEHKLLYQEYLQYLQLEREKCLEEGIAIVEKPKKLKKRKSKSKSPDKRKEIPVSEKKAPRPPILSFSEFCNNRELVSPDREITKATNKVKTSHDAEARKERTISIDSAATTATVRSDPVDPTDDDKELFITITDLEEQDKQRKEKRSLEQDKEKIETELEKDPELKSISVFTSVLFKGGADSEGIPFLSSECRPTSPKPAEVKPRKPFIQDTGIDEIYDMNDDLSNISQSSLSPSRSPVPKLHNKSLLNYLENQKERLGKKSPDKNSKGSRSRSKSPRRDRSKSKKRKRKHHSSISTVSPSPPPLRPRSPETSYRKRPSPPAYLKERWKDYPSPPELRLTKREHRLPNLARRRSRSRTRKVHRSRSSSEERERHYRRYRSRSRSRSRSPPVLTMVQLTAAEKRRKLREDHERALASLRETIRKPLSNTPLSITITNHGDSYEAVRDNYDPVVMNEDSSSNSLSEVEVMTEPSLPPLPPEPPPPAPAPPSAEKRDDLTVVTTYTSFVPLPNTNMVHPPMGYDVPMPSFGSWMPPVADMQHPNVMFPPPQMMNNYTTPPPQQHFPFMNQPPPPLPYQMTMPPPCHQHYRMPTQAPPGVNIVSVRQEVKNVKSNPIVITQISDEDEHQIHPLEGSKCKHNPLGENNQTVQEAIDSVKKCLKNCDALKNKDPRLAPVDGRKKSPERSGLSSKIDDRKVKITLNYKPRPVSDVEQTCVFEPANDESDCKSSGLSESNKPADENYTEKSSKIEGIVSKLKDNINTSTGFLLEKSIENRNPGDEPYDPFNVSDEINDSYENTEELKTNSSDKQNDRVHSVVLKDSTPKLSESEVENINDQINKSFSFILSHSIERKRLTPTLSSIVAKKAEKQLKSEANEKIPPTSKTCQLNQESQGTKNNNTDLSPLIKPSHSPPAEKSNACVQSVHKSETIFNKASYSTSQSVSKSSINKSQEKIKSSHINSKLEKNNLKTFDSEKSADVVLVKIPQMKLEKLTKMTNDADKLLTETESLNLSYNRKFDNLMESDSKKCTTEIPIQNDNVQSKPSVKDITACKPQSYIANNMEKSKDLFNCTEEDNVEASNTFCKKSNTHNKEEEDQFENQSENSKSPLERRLSVEKHKDFLDNESNKLCDDNTQNAYKNPPENTDNKINEYSFGINVDLIEKQDTKLLHGKIVFGESKNHYNSERRGNPPLSIPTKGELKRFPTPERSMPKTTKTESHLDTECDKSKLQKIIPAKPKDSRDNTNEKQFEEKVAKSPSSNVVESILHDFDESNSIGCDFQPLGEDKTFNNANKDIIVSRTFSPGNECDGSLGHTPDSKDLTSSLKSCLLTSNKISSKIDIKDQVPIVNCKVTESETHQNRSHKDTCGLNLSESKQLTDPSQKYDTSDEDVSSTAELTNVSSTETHLEEEADIPHDLSKVSQSSARLKDDKVRIVRRSRRKAKLSKSNICNNGDHRFSNYDSTETKKNNFENEPFQNPLLGEDIYFNNQNKIPVRNIENEHNDSKLQDLSSKTPTVLLKSPKSNKKQFKPRPLSRKSKSYISQNLPLSFDLSVDGHLIRRGFKKLRVSLHRLVQQPTTARPSDKCASSGVSSSCLNGANGDNDCYVDLLVESIAADIREKENACDKQTNNEKPKKRVSFDLNVSEIFDDSKCSSDDEDSVSTRTGSKLNCKEPDHRNDESSKTTECCDDDLPLEASHNTNVGTSKADETDERNTQASFSDCKLAVAAGKVCDDTQPNSLSSLYKEITKTLVSLRGSPLPQMHKRKTVVVYIPNPGEIPAVKVIEFTKKTSKANTKNLDLRATLDVPEQSKGIGPDEENFETESSTTKNLNTNETSRKCCIETLKSKSCDPIEVHESDNDDSMILDRELSDLAKGCLDSDSNVGEDDDSVLNFGIAASDESSVDSEFEFNCKNTFSKSSTPQKNKLSSPQNIKKRFVNKLRSVNVDVESNSNTNLSSEMAKKDENKLSDRRSEQSQQSLDDKKTPLSKLPEISTLESVSEEISLDKPIEKTEELFDGKEMEVPTSTKIKVYHTRITDSSLSKVAKNSETLRRTSKRQKNKSGKPLINSEDDTEETSEYEIILHTNKISGRNNEKNSENNVTINLHLREEGIKERNLQDDFSNHDCENNTNKEEESPNNNSPSASDKVEAVDSKKGPILQSEDEFNVNINDKADINLNIELQNTSENTCFSKTTQKNKSENENICNGSKFNSTLKTDIIERKLSPIRKTRRRKLLELDASGQPQLINSEDKTIQNLDTKTRGKVTEISRKRRSGRFVDNDLLCSSEENVPSQGHAKSPEETYLKNEDSEYADDNQVKTSERGVEVKESLTQRKTKNLSKSDQLVSDNTCVEVNISKTTEALKEIVKSKEECVDKGRKGNDKEDFNEDSETIPKHNELSSDKLIQETENIMNCENQKKEVKNLEDVTSTTSEITSTESVRKTRLSLRKKGVVLNVDKLNKRLNVDSVDSKFSREISESPVRITRSKKNICDAIEEEVSKNSNDKENKELTFENDKINIEIKKDELDTKNPHLVTRTLSTESSDEPLIFVKNKLLADKNKYITEETTSEYSESGECCKNNSGVLKNEDIKFKCKSSVSDGSANPSQGNTKESSVSNEGKNMQGTRSDGNESNSSNHSSNNNLSNTSNSNGSLLNMNGISNSNNSSNTPVSTSHNTTYLNQNVFPPVNSQTIFSSLIQQKCSMNPKLKEAMRKKRDKAEVDAEIKRRLAEIDELEKLAKSQHANVLEKIGARTRRRALDSSQNVHIDEEDDVVSISSDDSQGTSVGTNEATNTTSTIVDIGKSEDVNEEPTTTQEDVVKTCAPAQAEKDISPLGLLLKGSVSILPVDTTRRTKKKKTTEIESADIAKVENQIQSQTKNDINNVSKLCVEKSLEVNTNKKDDLITEKSMINLPPHVANNVTLEVYKKPLDTDEIPTSRNELDAPDPISEHLVKHKRDVVSVYQFRESDESEPDEEIRSKQKYNRISRRRAEIGKQKNRTNTTSQPLKKAKQLQEKSIRKTRHGSVVHESFTENCEISSRESSPFNMITRKPCEISHLLNDQSDLALSSNIIPEPDSSTSVIDPSCSHPGIVETPTDVPKDTAVRSSNQGEEINSVVSSNNTSQELDMIPSSPVTGFKQPYRKSLVTRRRRKRRSYFGRCLIPSNNLENPINESFEDSNDHTVTQSEEVVSSSVNTVQIPQDKKKRRRRKTVMDLLMEDSMLSVTRDFPMSPNPYMFSSFYKDIDLPNTNSKPNAVNESTATEQNAKKASEDRGLPLKPDFLAQKLRILEKLKSISRKNRKTRQCRTLVCYNEDSLPESLVESPVGESVQNNGDGGILSQDISAQISLFENNGECSTKSFQDSSVVPEVELKSAIEVGGDDGFKSLRKGQTHCLSKTPLKRGRKSKANKSLNNVNENGECETQSETATNVCIKENPSKVNFSSSAVLETKEDDPTFENSQRKNNIELSEFDKLLESKPKDSSRIKVTYDYDPGSPISPSEDKSDDAPDDFFNSLPSPRQSSDDDSSVSENSNDDQYVSPQRITGQNTCFVNDDNSTKHQLMRPEKIVCSILKTKIGKMLPYFGDTLSEDDGDDDDDLDEDIPLSIKYTQFNKEETEDFQQIEVKDDEDSSNSEAFSSLPVKTPKRPACKRRRKKITRLAPLSNSIKSERSTRSKSANSGGDDIITTTSWAEVSKKIDILDDSLDVNSDSPVQLRKSNRKLKTKNFLCKETLDNTKQNVDEGHIDKQHNEINNGSNINNETHLGTEDEPISLKRKGRPLKTKHMKENNIDKDPKKQNDQAIAGDENIVETEDEAKSEICTNLHFNRTREDFSGENDDGEDGNNCPKSVESLTVIQDDNEYSKSTINSKSQEQSKLQLSDLNSAIQKSISLRRTRAKSGKESIDLETNIEEANDIQKPENDCDGHSNQDCSLEDLPLHKRAARDIIPRKRGKKDAFSSDNTGHYSSRDNSVTKVEDSLEIGEDSYSNNKDEIDPSTGKCFSDSPPPLIRTRARRAKLITSDNNDLDPPSLETSIPPNIDNDKNDFVSSVNTERNLGSSETLISEDITLPPRKRGRKPKNASARIQQKSDMSEALFKTPNEIPVKEPNNSKTQETEEMRPSKSNSIEIQPLPRRRGRRGKRKVIRRRTGHKLNMSNKDADSDDDSEVEINIPRMPSNDNLPSEIDQQDELDSSISNIREDERDLADNCSENTDFTMQEDGRKKKRKIRENKQEVEATSCNPNALRNDGNENNTESEDGGTKKRKTQGCDEIEGDESRCEASASGTSKNEPRAYTAQSCANQPFLWNKISAFLNKTTRSVGTQVKVKNMVLKGFETSEPEVSLQSELTLPQVIKTLFEELRFIDSSFSNP